MASRMEYCVMKSALKNYRTRTPKVGEVLTPQNKPIPGEEAKMVVNEAGGYSYRTEDFTRLNRFLILGTEGGSYYVGEKKLTLQNIDCLNRCLAQDGKAVVDMIVDISVNGRAFKQDPLLFALATAASVGGDKPTPAQIEVRSYALAALPRVARTATMLFHFMEFVKAQRGYGRGLRRSVAAWYTGMDVNKLAQQAWKYKSRDGWTHKDVLSLVHAKPDDVVRDALFQYLAKPDQSPLSKGLDGLNDIQRSSRALTQVAAAEELLHLDPKEKGAVAKAVSLITDHRLEREAVPTALLNEARVWEALVPHMGVTALMRNLNKLTLVGLLAPMSDTSRFVIDKITNAEALKGARIHPMQALISAKQYAAGRGQDHGNGRTPLTWTPNTRVVEALDQAFYLSFGSITPSGKKILVGVDTSGSMSGGWGNAVMGIQGFTPLMCAAAMTLVILATEPNSYAIGFDGAYHEMPKLSPRLRIDEVLALMAKWQGGTTDTSLPFRYALDKKLDVDAVVTMTDNVTWSGYNGHPAEHMKRLEKKTGPICAINVAFVANGLSQFDPKGANALEVTGMDSSVPSLISEFVAGRV